MRLILSSMYLVYVVHFAFRRFYLGITGLFTRGRLIPISIAIGLCWLFGNFSRIEQEILGGLSFLSGGTKHWSGEVIMSHPPDSKMPPCLAS